jgi:hypothetical protein
VPSTNILTELADWVAAGTSFTKGTTLQVAYRLQNAPDRCVLITNTGGGKEYNIDSARKRFDYMLQFISRGNAWGDAQTDINLIHAFMFEGARGLVSLPTGSPTFDIESIEPVATPAPIGRDENQRFEWSINYVLKCFRY